MMGARHTHRIAGWFKTLCFTGAFMLGLAISGAAVSQEAAQCDFSDFTSKLATRESGGNCPNGGTGYSCKNSLGYLGKYQFGGPALQDLGYKNADGSWTGKNGINSESAFLNSASAQEDAYQRWIPMLESRTAYLDQYIGQTINGVPVTKSGIVAAAHLLGAGGVGNCLSGGKCTDGFSTSAFEYMSLMAGYNLPGSSGDGSCDQNYVPTGPSHAQTQGNPRCAEHVVQDLQAQVQQALALRQDIFNTYYPNPPSLSQAINTPCKSRELQHIGNKFAYAPSGYASDVRGILNGTAGPASGIMNKFFKADFQNFMNQSNFNPIAKSFQGFANDQLAGLLSSLGLEDTPFNDALCGLMVDTLLKYAMCEAPTINLPSLGDLDFSLNDLLPEGCAGDAIRSGLYQAAGKRDLIPSSQAIVVPPGGLYGPVAPSFSSDLPWRQ